MSTFFELPDQPALPPRSRFRGKHVHDKLRFGRIALAVLALSWVLVFPGSSTASDKDAKILTDSPASSFLVVEVEQTCSEERLRTIDAEVRWGFDTSDQTKAANFQEVTRSTEVSIDLTEFPRGFERGDFKRIAVPAERLQPTAKGGRLSAGMKPSPLPYAHLLTDLTPGIMYNARLLIRTEEGWVPSGIVRFRTPICAVDMADRDAGGDQ